MFGILFSLNSWLFSINIFTFVVKLCQFTIITRACLKEGFFLA